MYQQHRPIAFGQTENGLAKALRQFARVPTFAETFDLDADRADAVAFQHDIEPTIGAKRSYVWTI
jgi:hypothetical protein